MFHSNSSPFNQRQPKAGPSTVSLRYHQDAPQKPSVELPKWNPGTFKEGMADAQAVVLPSLGNQDEKLRKDMYLSFLRNALLQKSKGNVEPFDELVNQFGSSDSQRNEERGEVGIGASTTQLRLWVSALSHVVTQLERTHSALVEAVLSLPWAAMDSSFVDAYVTFVAVLLSARPEYLSLVLEKIARGFTFRSGLHVTDRPDSSTGSVTWRVVYDRLHHLLEHLLSLIPTLPSALQPLLVRNFPHKRQDKVDQETYIRNLLRITEYCPALGDRILAIIIDRAIQIDVEIQVEMDDLEVGDGMLDNEEVSPLDPFDTIVGQEGSDSEGEDDDDEEDDLSDLSSDAEGDDDDESLPGAEQDLAHVRDMIAKLDTMLKLLFDHFHRTHSSLMTVVCSTHDPPEDASFPTSSSQPSQELDVSLERGRDLRRSQFITLLSIFDRTILRTFKSRYTQFLVFWYSSLDPGFADMFQGLLVSRALFENTQPIVTRVAAASYIASFVSRALFVDDHSTQRVVGLLCDFLETHLDMYTAKGETIDPSASHHTLFYAVTQAVFLIFCFRWRDLQVSDEIDMDDLGIDVTSQKKWIPKLDIMQRVITSGLNPLKVCSPHVVQQFARVSQSTGFIYCYTILESNRRSESFKSLPDQRKLSSAPSTPQSQLPLLSRDAAGADLNTFFPFDPYKLSLSHSYVQGIYRDWGLVALDDDEEDEEGDDKEEVTVLHSSQNPWTIDVGEDGTASLGTSFGGMSISPVRSTLVRPSSAV